MDEIKAEQQPKCRGRPSKADKSAEDEGTSGQVGPKSEKAAKAPNPPQGRESSQASKVEKTTEPPAPPEPVTPPELIDATRPGEVEQIVYLNLSELHPFKDHPFQVKEDEEIRAMVSSVKDKGVTQPAIVRPREDGGYELVSGHRRHRASELAGMFNMPCIVRNLTDEQAITQMVEDNTNQREQILPSERAKALKMQLDAIKRQGARGPVEGIDPGKRSNEVVAERNKMTVKQVQRFIKLNDLVPELLDMLDKKAIGFTPAVEISCIKPKNQRYIAVAIEGQQSGPSLSQAQRMRELDQKKMLNPYVIDGIMLEEKKEADKVIISSQELAEYFGKDKTPREMKDQILQLRGLPPFFSPKYDLKQRPNYKYTAEADKKNAFDLGKLIDRRLRLNPDEQYTAYEVDTIAEDIGEDEDILNYDDGRYVLKIITSGQIGPKYRRGDKGFGGLPQQANFRRKSQLWPQLPCLPFSGCAKIV